MYKPRMTEEEYLATKQEINELKKQIDTLREKKNSLQSRVSWYERKNNQPKESYKKGFAYQYFGKRAKDLNTEEKKEYQRLLVAACRKSREV